jgi:hypothetical protein
MEMKCILSSFSIISTFAPGPTIHHIRTVAVFKVLNLRVDEITTPATRMRHQPETKPTSNQELVAEKEDLYGK